MMSLLKSVSLTEETESTKASMKKKISWKQTIEEDVSTKVGPFFVCFSNRLSLAGIRW